MKNFMEYIIKQYPKNYCLFLEETYGKNMLSEGGCESMEFLFAGVDCNDKKILDFGSGLGGVTFYLAENFNACVTGLEINPWLLKEAIRRTPSNLENHVKFISYDKIPFNFLDDGTFDIVFCKAVLVHIKEKKLLFDEFFRILKPGGIFIVDDWFSLKTNDWGDNIRKMCQIEGLNIYAETLPNFIFYLSKSRFSNIETSDRNAYYAYINGAISDRLKRQEVSDKFIQTFGRDKWNEAISCYRMIFDALLKKEILAMRITSRKMVR